jgi:hypothetical protein
MVLATPGISKYKNLIYLTNSHIGSEPRTFCELFCAVAQNALNFRRTRSSELFSE